MLLERQQNPKNIVFFPFHHPVCPRGTLRRAATATIRGYQSLMRWKKTLLIILEAGMQASNVVSKLVSHVKAEEAAAREARNHGA